jgi:indolepyruvate ferredoxin oxidoreductase beta subunit
MKKEEFNVILAGVGGQGIIFTGHILSTAALKSGYPLYCAENHGMAQRGGAVVTNLRFGNEIYTPQILEERADIIVGFEPLETLRTLHFLNPKGMIIINSKIIAPIQTTKSGEKNYPSIRSIKNFISERFDNTVMFYATTIAEKAGNPLTMSTVMLGAIAACKVLPIPEEVIQTVISEHVREEFLDINIKVFEEGYQHVKKMLK